MTGKHPVKGARPGLKYSVTEATMDYTSDATGSGDGSPRNRMHIFNINGSPGALSLACVLRENLEGYELEFSPSAMTARIQVHGTFGLRCWHISR